MPSESDKWGWKHVSVFGGFDKGSGTKRWKCNHCNLRYNGSYSRVRAHLLGFTGVGVKSCTAIDRSLREALQLLEGQRVSRKKKRISVVREPEKRIRVLKTLTKDDVDDTVARFFYADGLKVNSVNSPYFHEMTKAIANFGPGYEPPSVDKISETFLRKEKAKMEKTMALIRESWPHTACSILCDNCINVFVSSPRGIMFLKTIDISICTGEDLAFFNVLIDSIVEVGPSNVLQIISCLSLAGESYESVILSKFPHVFWSPCTSHSVRTLMEGIAEIDWIKPVVLCAKGIEKCIMAYQSTSLSSFTQNLKERFDPVSAKLAPSHFTVQRIVELKQALQEVVISEEWKDWRLTIIEEEITNIETAILGNDFWGKALLFLQLFKPFITLLSTLNINKSVMGDVYFWRFQALEAVRNNGIDEIAVNELAMLIESRWETLFSPLHAAGYILNPKYFGRGQIRDKTVMQGWKATLERYEYDSGARRVLREQLSSYCRLEGSFGEEDAMDSRDKMDPVAWWENFGFETLQLQTLAIKILSQVSSVPMCQESSLDYDFECQERANRLGVQREEDLVFVRNNLKLQSIRNGNMNFPSGSRNGNFRI